MSHSRGQPVELGTSIGGLFVLVALLMGGVDTGWTFTRLSARCLLERICGGDGTGAFWIGGFSSILTGLNFIVTIHKMRAPGMTWFRLPLFVWAHYATSVMLQVLGTPVDCGHRCSLLCWFGAWDRRRPRRMAAIRCCSSTCSGSTRTRRFTSGHSAVDGSGDGNRFRRVG